MTCQPFSRWPLMYRRIYSGQERRERRKPLDNKQPAERKEREGG